MQSRHSSAKRIEFAVDQYLAFADKSTEVSVWDNISRTTNCSNLVRLPWDRIHALIDKAVASDEKSATFQESLGGTLYRLGQYEAAEAALTQAIELSKPAEKSEVTAETSNDLAHEVERKVTEISPPENQSTTTDDVSKTDQPPTATEPITDKAPAQPSTDEPKDTVEPPPPVVGSYYAHAFLAMTYFRLSEPEKSAEHQQLMSRLQVESPANELQERLRRKLLGDEVEQICGSPK